MMSWFYFLFILLISPTPWLAENKIIKKRSLKCSWRGKFFFQMPRVGKPHFKIPPRSGSLTVSGACAVLSHIQLPHPHPRGWNPNGGGSDPSGMWAMSCLAIMSVKRVSNTQPKCKKKALLSIDGMNIWKIYSLWKWTRTQARNQN